MTHPNASQLWSKDLPLDVLVHRFTVGEDPLLDLELLPWDCLGSAAHVRMLAETGLLQGTEAKALVDGLRRVSHLVAQRAFHILPEQEDGHTALEAELTRMLGDTGKRVHLGRSRNDQVALALRLLMRDALLALGGKVARLAGAFLGFAEAHRDQPLPGYTHLRRAMPSSWGQWGQAFAEGLAEELAALPAVYARLDRCPLGAAAGFGAPVPLDRERVAGLLGNYHRDLQLMKKPLLSALRCADQLFDVATRLVGALEVRTEACAAACTPDQLAAGRALHLAASGLPFRDAYRQVAQELKDGTFDPDPEAFRSTHTGGTANLDLPATAADLARGRAWIEARTAHLTAVQSGVWDVA